MTTTTPATRYVVVLGAQTDPARPVDREAFTEYVLPDATTALTEAARWVGYTVMDFWNTQHYPADVYPGSTARTNARIVGYTIERYNDEDGTDPDWQIDGYARPELLTADSLRTWRIEYGRWGNREYTAFATFRDAAESEDAEADENTRPRNADGTCDDNYVWAVDGGSYETYADALTAIADAIRWERENPTWREDLHARLATESEAA